MLRLCFLNSSRKAETPFQAAYTYDFNLFAEAYRPRATLHRSAWLQASVLSGESSALPGFPSGPSDRTPAARATPRSQPRHRERRRCCVAGGITCPYRTPAPAPSRHATVGQHALQGILYTREVFVKYRGMRLRKYFQISHHRDVLHDNDLFETEEFANDVKLFGSRQCYSILGLGEIVMSFLFEVSMISMVVIAEACCICTVA